VSVIRHGGDPGRLLDEYLVVLCQAGSADALDRLARRWTPRLMRYARRLLGSGDTGEMARDVVQETWVGALRGLRRLRDPGQFPAWIYGITTRKCADAIRATVRRRRFDGDVSRSSPASGAAVEDQIDLATAIRKLPIGQRAVVHLFYREDLSIDEIAAILEIPPGTVKSRLHHAREALKQQLRVPLPQ
jgi:RNA polymerase sigma factor (sigma-70 family)